MARTSNSPAEDAPRTGRVVYGSHSFRKKAGSSLRDISPLAAKPADPAPIWFAALLATHCQANAQGSGHTVRWNVVGGRALYTNHGTAAEWIDPFGVSLPPGQTLAVSWTAGETAYTLEVIRQYDYCA